VQIGVIEAQSRRVAPARRWFDEHEWLSIGGVEVEAWPLVTTLPAQVEHQLEQEVIAGGLRLRGYDVAESDDALQLTLYWQAERPPKRNYHVFVHVGVPDEPPLAQAGGVPSGWTRPTTTWRSGEVIVDEYAVSLTDIPPGEYGLLVGLYDPDTGQRPETSVDGQIVPGGYVVLEEVDVE
jgi:hypothetical protein